MISTTKTKEQLLTEIDRVLDTIREGIALHSGGVDLLDIDMETGVVKVRMKGMCVGCPMSELTLKAGIEDTVRMMVPEVTEVVSAADANVQTEEACAHQHDST